MAKNAIKILSFTIVILFATTASSASNLVSSFLLKEIGLDPSKLTTCEEKISNKFGTTDSTVEVTCESENDKNRIVDSKIISQLVFGLSLQKNQNSFFFLKGARIVGNFRLKGNLSNLDLLFENCIFDDEIQFSQLELNILGFKQSTIDSITATFITINGIFGFSDDSYCKKTIELIGAAIKGHLVINNSKFLNKGGIAIRAPEIKIGGNVVLSDSKSEGEVDFSAAQIDGSFIARDFEGTTINADGIRTKDVVLTGSKLNGRASFVDARIDGKFDCDLGRFKNSNGISFNATRANINGNLSFSSSVEMGKSQFKSVGEVKLLDTVINGVLLSNGGQFDNPEGMAINAQRLVAKHGVLLRNGFRAIGGIDLFGSKIGGVVDLNGSLIKNGKSNFISFNASNSFIEGDLSFSTIEENKKQIPFKSIGQINLSRTEIKGILVSNGGQLENPIGIALNAEGISVGHGVILRNGFKAIGGVSFFDAKINGSVDLSGGIFEKGKNDFISIQAAQSYIDGSLKLSTFEINDQQLPFKCIGSINLTDATINGPLVSKGGQFENKDGTTINAQRIKAKGGVFLSNGSKSNGLVDFSNSKMDGPLDLNGSTFERGENDIRSIIISNASINGNVLLSSYHYNNEQIPFKSIGEIDLIDTEINGVLSSNGGQFENIDGTTINAQRIKVKGGVLLRNGFKSIGKVDFFNARIDNSVYLNGGSFQKGTSDIVALQASNASINGDLNLSRYQNIKENIPFKSTGQIGLAGAEINGSLTSQGGQLENSEGITINAPGLKSKSVFLGNDFNSKGKVVFSGAAISRNFVCTSSEFTTNEGNVLSLNGSTINGDVRLSGLPFDDKKKVDDSFVTNGGVDLSNTHILGNLIFFNSSFKGNEKPAFYARSINIEGDAQLTNFSANGIVDFTNATINRFFKYKDVLSAETVILRLSHAKVGVLDDEKKSWPVLGKLDIDGFIYNAISNVNVLTSQDRIEWIRRQYATNTDGNNSTDKNLLRNKFNAQPYEQLASYYKGNGFDKEFGEVEIAKNDDLRKTGRLGWMENISQISLGTIGYGYKVSNAVLASFVVIMIGWIVFHAGFKSGTMVKTNQSEIKKIGSLKFYQSFIYSLDMFIPIVNLFMAVQFQPDSNLVGCIRFNNKKIRLNGSFFQIYMWIHMISGWILTTIMISSLTGLLK
jgi:hypothetical protein